MLSIGVLGINFKTADLQLREEIARGAESLNGERALFFRHPTVLLSTCNRTEIYFSSENLAEAHTDLLALLRTRIETPFEHRLYSYFGIDCFAHLCRVAAGLDSAILAETEIQRQVKVAYANAKVLPSCLHYAFQKALKVSKYIRSHLELERGAPTLYGTIWQLAKEFKNILLVGYSEINRGFASFLMHKGVKDIALCTRNPSSVRLEGVRVYDRRLLSHWQEFDLIVSASKADGYLITGKTDRRHLIFDLSVPRNVDPAVNAELYNMEQLNHLIEQKRNVLHFEQCEELVLENVLKLTQIYQLKTSRQMHHFNCN